jgi:phage-related protein
LKYKDKKYTLGLYSGLYEVRIDVGSDIYRVFSFFDKGKLVILINGFQKKTQKTPKKEIKIG